MKNKPRFNIGDTIITKVSVRGSSEPSFCQVHEKLEINEVRKYGDTFQYSCGYDNYLLTEDQIMSIKEYKKSL